MPREFSRSIRLGDQIQRELAEVLERDLKDPRVGMVTITSVRMSRDLAHATVYVTALGNADAVHGSLQALRGAAGFLRSALSTRFRSRTIPALHFVHDASVERGARIGALIDAAIASDRSFHEGGDLPEHTSSVEEGSSDDHEAPRTSPL